MTLSRSRLGSALLCETSVEVKEDKEHTTVHEQTAVGGCCTAASVVIVINKGTAVAAHLRVRDWDNSLCHFLLRYAPHCKVHPAVGLWLIGTTNVTENSS